VFQLRRICAVGQACLPDPARCQLGVASLCRQTPPWQAPLSNHHSRSQATRATQIAPLLSRRRLCRTHTPPDRTCTCTAGAGSSRLHHHQHGHHHHTSLPCAAALSCRLRTRYHYRPCPRLSGSLQCGCHLVTWTRHCVLCNGTHSATHCSARQSQTPG
jgi:hypothetical protein